MFMHKRMINTFWYIHTVEYYIAIKKIADTSHNMHKPHRCHVK